MTFNIQYLKKKFKKLSKKKSKYKIFNNPVFKNWGDKNLKNIEYVIFYKWKMKIIDIIYIK